MRAALTLPGYPVLYIVESRPLPGSERIEEKAPPAIVPAGLTYIRVRETAFSGFVAGAVDPSVFAVPAGYKKTKSLKYMPD